MDEAQQRRIAVNESRFREANEHIAESVDAIRGDNSGDVQFSIMCECAIPECLAMVDVSRSAYEAVRVHPSQFMVRPDHVLPAAEDVISKLDDYWIVEKIEAGKVVAELLDPRSDA